MYYTNFYRKDMSTAFSPLGGLSCPRKKKKKRKKNRLRKLENIRKISKLMESWPSAQCSSQNENVVNTSKKHLTNRNGTFQ